MGETRHGINLPSGVTLEGVLAAPTTVQPGCAKLAVCIHPWSRLGGSMNDPVLHTLSELLQRLDYHVLRFNCRGVGRSTGWASLTGLTEGKDLQDVTAWAMKTIPDVRSLVIIGYSYGALIGSLHSSPPVQTSYILLSYPLGVRGLLTLFHSSTYATALKELIQHSSARVLVVYGDQDEFTGSENYSSWTKELREIEKGRDTLSVAVVEQGTHFWHGRAGKELIRVVEMWL